MADEPEQDDEVLNLTEEVETPEPTDEQPAEEQGDDEEVVVGFADEQPVAEDQDGDNSTVRTMRQRIRELEKQVKATAPAAPAKIEIPPKPTLESCDYDEDTYDTEKAKWDKIVADAKAQETDAEKAEKARAELWETRTARYVESKAKLGGEPVDDAALIVDEALGARRSPALLLAQDPAALTLALSRSPAKLKELADTKDDYELAYMIGKLEGGVKVERRKRTPAIDRPASGNASGTVGSTDATLKRLQEKADKTNDRTELVAYKKKLAAK